MQTTHMTAGDPATGWGVVDGDLLATVPSYRVLGPVTMGRRTPGAPKLRTLLATLLLRANEVVSSQTLVDELWGEEPPRTAVATLQVYISQLRTLLCGADQDDDVRYRVLQTMPPGYRLCVTAEDLDLARFGRLRGDGCRASEQGDYREAGCLFRQALAQWSGTAAIAGTPHGPVLTAAAVHLEESRINSLEGRITADLHLGRHRDITPELFALTAEYPYREALHAQLMIALYRGERRSDALLTFCRLRRTLMDELGVEPSPRLIQLHERVLLSDPVLLCRNRVSRRTAPWVRRRSRLTWRAVVRHSQTAGS